MDDEPSAVTDESGRYVFDRLAAGQYTVAQVAPVGWLQTAPPSGIWEIDLAYGQVIDDADFGAFRMGTVGGVVFEDSNGNGDQDGSERGLADWTVFLDANRNGLLDDGEVSTVTNDSGGYTFKEVMPGDHRLAEVVQPGWVPTAPRGGFFEFTIGSGQCIPDGDFANIFPGVIGGNVFGDLDRDGLRDLGEPGLGGWTVQLDRIGTTTRALDGLFGPGSSSQDQGRDLSSGSARRWNWFEPSPDPGTPLGPPMRDPTRRLPCWETTSWWAS